MGKPTSELQRVSCHVGSQQCCLLPYTNERALPIILCILVTKIHGTNFFYFAYQLRTFLIPIKNFENCLHLRFIFWTLDACA